MEVRSCKGISRVEVLDGPTGRRQWPDGVKARIVAKSLAPGTRVCDVAQKYGLIAGHVSQWRGLARQTVVGQRNRAIWDATVKRYHRDDHVKLRKHLADPLAACNSLQIRDL